MPLPRSHPAPRRPIQAWPAADDIADCLRAAVDMLAVVAEAHAGFAAMLIRVIGNHMAFVVGAPHKVGVPANIHANPEERRLDIQLAHGVEQTLGTRLARAVVEGDRDSALVARAVIVEIAKAPIWRAEQQGAGFVYKVERKALGIQWHSVQRLLSIWIGM